MNSEKTNINILDTKNIPIAIPIAIPIDSHKTNIKKPCRDCWVFFVPNPSQRYSAAYYRCEKCQRSLFKRSIKNSICTIS